MRLVMYKHLLMSSKMKTYCVKCRKDLKIFRTKNNILVMQSKCSICGIKNLRFVKEQEAKILLSNLRIRKPLSKIQWVKF